MTQHQEHQVWWGIAGLIILLALLIPITIYSFNITYDFTLRTVMLGSGILGIISGVLGTFAVLRKQSLMGDTLAHAALPGVAIAFLVAGRELGWLLIGAGLTGWLTTLFIQALLRTTLIKQDAAMGIGLTVMFGWGVGLLGYIQGREDASRAGLKTFIFGQAAAIGEDDVVLISIVTAIVIGIVVLLWKEFKLITFDMEFARTNGYPVRFLDTLLSTLVVIAIVLGLQLAGVILMVGLLIAPAVGARQWTNSLGQMAVLAGVFGAFSGISGTLISATQPGLPTGPLIIITATLIVFASITLAPRRGLIWQAWRSRQDSMAFASEQVLQDIYKIATDHNTLTYFVPEGMLTSLRGRAAEHGLRELIEQDWVQGNTQQGWQLTASGIAQAEAVIQNRQLWQHYRLNHEQLNLPVVLEDWRKPIEDFLPAEAIAQLKQSLNDSGINHANN